MSEKGRRRTPPRSEEACRTRVAQQQEPTLALWRRCLLFCTALHLQLHTMTVVPAKLLLLGDAAPKTSAITSGDFSMSAWDRP